MKTDKKQRKTMKHGHGRYPRSPIQAYGAQPGHKPWSTIQALRLLD